MGSGSKRKKATKRPRQPLQKGATSDGSPAGAASSVTVRNASSPPIHDPPAIHAPSSSASSSITIRNLNDPPPDQVTGSHMITAGGMFTNASNFTMHKPSFVDLSTINHYHQQPADSDAARAMERLLNHTLRCAAHDSSARNPPPRCHPGTRIGINKRIIEWFYDAKKREWLLWINGLAGVGKSAIVQTLAEELALVNHLGASVFISRPRKCNGSQHIFLTIAYQLAQRIDAYYAFITAKLVRDPGLVDKGMKEQFQTFIIEPFVEKKIGAGGNSWAILLDGLDELDTRRGQLDIIRLITSFVLEHPQHPLIWVISSRPEPHISTTFEQDKVVPSYTEEEIPIDSDEACKDVEHYLNSSLESIRDEFPHVMPQEDWPSQSDVWKLAHVASGLFAFAEVAIRFIGDMDYANPVTRLGHVLLAIDHVKVGTLEDWPFAYLDALYTRILESIPPEVWPTTKRVFSVLLHSQVIPNGYEQSDALCPREISQNLDLDVGTIRASLNNCSSVLNTRETRNGCLEAVTFYHASFADYLLDSARSVCFHISKEDAEEEMSISAFRIWQRFQAQFPPGLDSEYPARWSQFLKEDAYTYTNGFEDEDYHPFSPISDTLYRILVQKHTKQEGYFVSDEDRDRCFDLLRQLDSSTVCQEWHGHGLSVDFFNWIFEIWTEFGEELAGRDIIHEVPFEHLRLDHLDWPILYPRFTYVKRDANPNGKYFEESCSRGEDISGIKDLQRRCPQLLVLICGCPGKRFALFKDPKLWNGMQRPFDFYDSPIVFYEATSRYYIIPYPDPQDVQQFLKVKLDTIRANFSQTVLIDWPIEADFRRLADAASGRYVFAAMAIRFIEDRNHADPISRLEEIFSIVNGHKDTPYSDEASFLDDLYTHVFSSIPSTKWPITKRVLGALLYIQSSFRQHSINFQEVCEILGLDQDMVYALLDNYSFATVLPEQSHTHYKTVTFYHTSLVDYLTDPTRSEDFHISIASAKEDVLWSNFGEKFRCSREYARMPICLTDDYDPTLSPHIPDAVLDLLITNPDPRQPGGLFVSQEDRDRCFEMLGQLNARIVFNEGFDVGHVQKLFARVFDFWKMFREELTERGIIREVEFTELRFDHLDQEACQKFVTCTRSPGLAEYKLWDDTRYNFRNLREGSSARVSSLESFQQSCPQLPVLICGSPGNRFALFEYLYTAADLTLWPWFFIPPPTSGLYIIPHPDEVRPYIY